MSRHKIKISQNFSSLWNLEDYCQRKQDEYQNKGIRGRWEVNPESLGPPSKKPKIQQLQDATEMKVSKHREN